MSAVIKVRHRRQFVDVLVDAKDFPELSQYYWEILSDGYARRRARREEILAGTPRIIAMHRQIMGLHKAPG